MTDPDKTSSKKPRGARFWVLFGSAAVGVAAFVASGLAGPVLGYLGDKIKQGVVTSTAPKFDVAHPITVDHENVQSGFKVWSLDRLIKSPADNAAILDEKVPSDAIPADERSDDFFFGARTDSAVSIISITAVDVHTAPTIDTTCIEIPSAGGGGSGHLTFEVDLASGELSQEGTTANYFASKTIDLTSSSRLVLTFDTQPPREGTTSWIYKVDLLQPAPSHGLIHVYFGQSGHVYAHLQDVPKRDRISVTSEADSYQMVYGPNGNNDLVLFPGPGPVPPRP